MNMIPLTVTQVLENGERVAAGAAWLDATSPGWADTIDLATLDLQNPCGCVMGQIVSDITWGDFYTVVAEPNESTADVVGRREDVGELLGDYVMSHEEAVERGFQVDFARWNDEVPNPTCLRGNAGDDDFKHLTELWKVEIQERVSHD